MHVKMYFDPYPLCPSSLFPPMNPAVNLAATS